MTTAWKDQPDLTLVGLIKEEIHRVKEGEVSKVAGALLDMSSVPTFAAFGVPTPEQDSEFNQYQASMAEVMRLVNLEEGLDKIVEWFIGRISGDGQVP